MYAVAHLYDGRVAAFSRRDDLQGKTLDDPVSQRALQATEPLVQTIILPEIEAPGYDVAIPVLIPGSSKKWGTIRIGFFPEARLWADSSDQERSPMAEPWGDRLRHIPGHPPGHADFAAD